MAFTVDDVQSRVAAVVDQDEDTDNISSTDYSLRLEYINRRERTWAETGKWQALYTEYNSIASTSTGNASVALPTNFRMLAARPKITYDGVTTVTFPEIRGQEESTFTPSADRYVKVMGNDSVGHVLYVNSTLANNDMASGASIFVPYFSTPSSLASPTNTIICPNPDYIVQGVIADIWEAREDAKFQQAQIQANLILQNMLEFEFTPSEAAYNDRVRNVDQAKYGFRWGK